MMMQDLGLFQLQKPAGDSKIAFLGNPVTSGPKSEFENLLAGFLGSQGTPLQQTSAETTLDISMLFQKNANHLDQDLMASLVLFDQFQADIPSDMLQMQEELAKLFAPLLFEKDPDFQIMKQDQKEHLADLQQKFPMIFEEMKLANIGRVAGMHSGDQTKNQTNWVQDFLMFGRVTQENAEEFIKFQEFFKDFQGGKQETVKLGRELMNILTDTNKQQVSVMSEKAGLLKAVIQNDQPKDMVSQVSALPEEEETAVVSVKAETGKEPKAGSELPRQAMPANPVQQENIQMKEELVFQKTLSETVRQAEEKPLEKVETRELPKFIENQIKNSFRQGESGTREITVRIHPEHLGKLTLKIVSDENRDMSVRIMAENRNVKEFLDTNLGSLRTTLENSGIKATSFSIEVDFEKNFNQFSGSNQSNQNQSQQNNKRVMKDEELQDKQADSIFNQSGGLEVFA